MKKSGTRVFAPRAAFDASVDAVIAPECNEVAIQVLTESHDLSLEAPAQLQRQLLLGGTGPAVQGVALERLQAAMAQPPGGEQLDRCPHRPRDRAPAEVEGTHELVDAR